MRGGTFYLYIGLSIHITRAVGSRGRRQRRQDDVSLDTGEAAGSVWRKQGEAAGVALDATVKMGMGIRRVDKHLSSLGP